MSRYPRGGICCATLRADWNRTLEGIGVPGADGRSWWDLWYGSSGELQKAVIGNRWGVHDNFNAWDFEFDSEGIAHASSNLVDLKFGTEGRPTPNLGNPVVRCFWESRTRSVAGDFPTGNQVGPIGESKRDCMEALPGNLGFPLAAPAQGECGNMGIEQRMGEYLAQARLAARA